MAAFVEYKNNGDITITFPSSAGVRPGTYRSENSVTLDIDGEKLTVKPPLRAYRTAKSGKSVTLSPVEVQSAIKRVKAEKLKWERFRLFCKEDGMPESGTVVHADGSSDVYQPDAMGYPTLVMRLNAAGNMIF